MAFVLYQNSSYGRRQGWIQLRPVKTVVHTGMHKQTYTEERGKRIEGERRTLLQVFKMVIRRKLNEITFDYLTSKCLSYLTCREVPF